MVFLVGLVAVCLTGFLSTWASINIMQKRAISDSKSINEQIMKQMDSVFQNIIDLSTKICLDADLDEMILQYNKDYHNSLYKRKISLSLSNITSQNNYLQNIIIRTDKGEVYEALVSDDNEAGLFDSVWYKDYKSKNYYRYFSGPTDVNVGASNQQYFYFCTRYENNSGLHGDLILSMTFDSVQYALESAGKYFESYMVLNRNNTQLYPLDMAGDSPINLDKILPAINNIKFSKEVAAKELNGYNLVRISERSGWKLISYVSNKTLLSSYLAVIIINVCVALFFFIIMAAILVPMLSNIIRPVNTLAKNMSEVSKGNFDIKTEIKTGDEIEDLSKSFNYMVVKIKEYIETLIEKEKTEQKMAYSLLISQINPHFIYNTMNTINYLARKNRNEDVVTVNNALIQILQDRLRVKRIEIFDSIGKEVDIVKKYLLIQKYRYGENVEVVWEIDDNADQHEIPKNIIQPLVENAIVHGLLSNVDEDKEPLGGIIRICISIEENNIVIRVIDNGTGIGEENLSRINSWDDTEKSSDRGRHIGLKNIRDRLAYLYGKKDLLIIESELGKGTVVTVNIPVT